MNTIKKLIVALAIAVPCLLAAPAVPAETLGVAVETELEATSRWNQGFFTPYGFICIPEPCRGGWCCRITRF